MGRNLAQLRAELGGQAQQHFQKIASGAAGVALAGASGSGDGAGVDSAAGRGQGQGQGGSLRGQAGAAGAAGAASREAGAGRAARGQGGVPVPQTASSDTPATTALYENLTTWNFGKLPDLLEIRRGGQTLFGYPALVDRGTHCDVEVFDSPDEAARIHRAGLRRLFALQLKEPIKYLEKNLPGLREMAMQFMPRGTQEELRDQLVDTALDRACLQDPLPADDLAFHTRRDEGRSRLTLLAQEIARLVGQILGEYASVTKKLVQAKPFAAAHADMQSQLDALIGKRFVIDTPYAQLAHFPRYLKGIVLRIDKLKADATRDARQFTEFHPLLQNYQRALAQRGGVMDARLAEFRWMLEELRISLFAQELRTPMPVSVKRLYKVWESMQR